ncbi:MAG: SRPBCC family protein [Actinomycetota bacterium]|uniref:SRPBCC family protein n=1 Tax=Micrococcaceae TaxID=1268 RepID=UPI0024B96013|nr:SRPBCC family protein [Paenarthrobacter sp. PH39-S1]MDJ0357296.1 SRPBCC family protein [Paenarthrobacter sp. PH39-S1]MDQ6741096.1 SRPBCC family protein [Actinomycetota bacterium]
MKPASRHISTAIERPAAEVYAYASDPIHLPQWAAGLTGSPVERVDDHWLADSPMGQVRINFTGQNPYGVLDHEVTLPSGETIYNPMRVIADGGTCEVVFTIRRRPGMSEEDFARDVEAVAADLAGLKRVAETGY